MTNTPPLDPVDPTLKIALDLLSFMVEHKASDLVLTVGFPPAMKIDGKLTPVGDQAFTEQHLNSLVQALTNDKQRRELEATKELNYAFTAPDPKVGRFRVNVMVQQQYYAITIRALPTDIPSMESLRLPEVLKRVIMHQRGLVIVVGATGSGKSTTLASMLDYRNENSQGIILTFEDPIEFVHRHKKCVVHQREIGLDTDSWENAIRNALRQAPNVLLMGEIRDRQTMDHAIQFAETGHLCVATLHANNANQALDRIINFFPEERRPQLLMDLSLNIRAFVSQRLIAREGAPGRAAAVEILLNTPYISDLIFNGKVHEIKDAMRRGRDDGMQTFDQALFDLYEQGLIGYENALAAADSLNDLRLEIRQSSQRLRNGPRASSGEGLSMKADPQVPGAGGAAIDAASTDPGFVTWKSQSSQG